MKFAKVIDDDSRVHVGTIENGEVAGLPCMKFDSLDDGITKPYSIFFFPSGIKRVVLLDEQLARVIIPSAPLPVSTFEFPPEIQVAINKAIDPGEVDEKVDSVTPEEGQGTRAEDVGDW